MTAGPDYAPTGPENHRAVQRGPTTAEWYESHTPRALMKEPMAGNNGRAARATMWLDVCSIDELPLDEVVRFDHGDRTFAVYHTADSRLFATDGACAHGKVHPPKGCLSAAVSECANHDGRFDIASGRALGAPVLVGGGS